MRSSFKILLFVFLTFLVADYAIAKPESRLKGPKGVDYGAMGEVYGPVTSRDTMWQLGNKFRVKNDVSVYQVMVAILKKNPQAFDHDNLNGLRNGTYLKIPSHAEVRDIEPAFAKQRADADDELWADRVSGKFSNKKAEQLLAPIEDAKQIDVKVAKQEIEQKIEAVQEEQIEKLNAIQVQFDTSQQTVESVLAENQMLQDKLTALGEQLVSVQEALVAEKEMRDSMLQILEQLSTTAQQDLANTTILVEEKGPLEQAAEFASSTAGIVTLSTSATLALLFFVGMALKKRNAPQPGAEPQNVPPPPVASPPPMAEPAPMADFDLSEPVDDLDDALDGLDLGDDLLDDDIQLDVEDDLDMSDDVFGDDLLGDDTLLDDGLSDDLLDDSSEAEEIDVSTDDGDEILKPGDIEDLLESDSEEVAEDLIPDMDDEIDPDNILSSDDIDGLLDEESSEAEQEIDEDALLDTSVDDVDEIMDELGIGGDLDEMDEIDAIEDEIDEIDEVVEDSDDFDIDDLIDNASEEAAADEDDFDIDKLIEDTDTVDADETEQEISSALEDDFDIDALIDDANSGDDLHEAEDLLAEDVEVDVEDIDALLSEENGVSDGMLDEFNGLSEEGKDEPSSEEEEETSPLLGDLEDILDDEDIIDPNLATEPNDAVERDIAEEDSVESEAEDPFDVDALIDESTVGPADETESDELSEELLTESELTEDDEAPVDVNNIDALLDSTDVSESQEESTEIDGELDEGINDDLDSLIGPELEDVQEELDAAVEADLDELVDANSEETSIEESPEVEVAATDESDLDEQGASELEEDAESLDVALNEDDIQDLEPEHEQESEAEQSELDDEHEAASELEESSVTDDELPIDDGEALEQDTIDAEEELNVDEFIDEEDESEEQGAESDDFEEVADESALDDIDLAESEVESDQPIRDVEASAELDVYPELDLDESLDDIDIDELGDDLSEGIDETALVDADIENLLSDPEQSAENILGEDDIENQSFDETDIENLLSDGLDDSLDESSEVSEPNEESFRIDELEQADFDQLLSELADDFDTVESIEEASLVSDEDLSTDIADELGDDLASELDSLEQDFVSVDNLIDDLDDGEEVEVPDDLGIDVGLGEFDELSELRGSVDVDLTEGGMATQLDLARTYFEMDDEENAQLLLNEILEAGNDEAKAQAEALLKEFKNE